MSEVTQALAASRERIRSIADRAAAGPVPVVDDDGGWGPAVVLAHMAFWDRIALARWHRADRQAEPVPGPLAPDVSDLVNEAAFADWALLDVEAAARLALQASATLDAYIEAIAPERADAARAAGLGRLLDRTLHRNEHLDTIERSIG